MSNDIDQKVQDFFDQVLHELIAKIICKGCHSPSCSPDVSCREVLGTCPGVELISDIELTIKIQGLDYMKKLFSDWKANSVGMALGLGLIIKDRKNIE
jgi:hypothetical protein